MTGYDYGYESSTFFNDTASFSQKISLAGHARCLICASEDIACVWNLIPWFYYLAKSD